MRSRLRCVLAPVVLTAAVAATDPPAFVSGIVGRARAVPEVSSLETCSSPPAQNALVGHGRATNARCDVDPPPDRVERAKQRDERSVPSLLPRRSARR